MIHPIAVHQRRFAIIKLNPHEEGESFVDNYEVVLDCFRQAEKPLSAGQIATATGLEKKDVDKVMTRLKKEETIVSPKVCYWELKK